MKTTTKPKSQAKPEKGDSESPSDDRSQKRGKLKKRGVDGKQSANRTTDDSPYVAVYEPILKRLVPNQKLIYDVIEPSAFSKLAASKAFAKLPKSVLRNIGVTTIELQRRNFFRQITHVLLITFAFGLSFFGSLLAASNYMGC